MFNAKLATCLFGVAAAFAAVTPVCAQYTKVVVFSDSMSDNHRYFEFTKSLTGTGYPAPPSFGGRFCNGPVAVENLASGLKVPVEGYAFSGAQTGYGTLLLVPLGVLTQVNEYLNGTAIVPTVTTLPWISTLTSIIPGTGRADAKALHVIWSGPDDFYSPGGLNPLTAYAATANIQQAITSLYNGGARYFFVPTMPDLSITPSARKHEQSTPGYIASAAKYSAQFSVVLSKGLDAMRAKYPTARIMSFDTLPFLKAEREKARLQGKNVVDACYPGGLIPTNTPRVACPDPDNHLFWDDNHPTAEANRILANGWLKAIVYQP